MPRFNPNKIPEDKRRHTPELFLERARTHLAKAKAQGDAEAAAALANAASALAMLADGRHSVEAVAILGRACEEIRLQVRALPQHGAGVKLLSESEYADKVRALCAEKGKSSELRGYALMSWAQAMMDAQGYRIRTAADASPVRRFVEKVGSAFSPGRPAELGPLSDAIKAASVDRRAVAEEAIARARANLGRVATPQHLSPKDYEDLIDDVSQDISDIPGTGLNGAQIRAAAAGIVEGANYFRREARR